MGAPFTLLWLLSRVFCLQIAFPIQWPEYQVICVLSAWIVSPSFGCMTRAFPFLSHRVYTPKSCLLQMLMGRMKELYVGSSEGRCQCIYTPASRTPYLVIEITRPCVQTSYTILNALKCKNTVSSLYRLLQTVLRAAWW